MSHTASPPSAESHESTWRFSPREWTIFAVIILGGIVLRWLLLDMRPMHHDESLHGMYGRYFFDFPEQNFYKYNPMLHGPFLYNMLRFVYNTLGSSTWAIRASIALLGTLLIFLPFLARRHFSKSAVLLLTAVVALSPTLIYWSRFIREDIPSLCSMLLMVYAVVFSRPQLKAPLFLFGFAWMFTIKENSFVTSAILLGYLIFDFLFQRIVLRDKDTAVARLWGHIKAYRWETFFGFLLAALWYCYLFSAGFRYSEGILDGLYRESIGYWLEHHSMERIKGPFNFHIYVLSWYELPFFIAFITHLACFYRRADRWAKLTGLAAIAGLIFALIHALGTPVESFPAWQIFKLKDKLDLVGLFVLLVHPFLVTVQHTVRRERSLAIWGYLFTANLFTYSYLGEKVPWLTIYPFVAGIIYLTLFFQAEFKLRPVPERVALETLLLWGGSILGILTLIFIIEEGFESNKMLLGLTCVLLALGYIEGWRHALGSVSLRGAVLLVFTVYSFRAAVLTNYTYAGKANEFLSQVHTTHEFHNLVLKIRDDILNPIGAKKPTLLGTGDVVWPITWYLVDIPQYKFAATNEERPNFSYIFQDFRDPHENVPAGWEAMKVPLRGWWVPDYSKMTLKRYLAYALNHTPWNDPGYSDLSFLSNPKR
ncbi:MAG: hypothetical protein RL417_1707 [Pseudomonadota bacterium]|jgi:uncharacterized protein (TIGR03663 family)